jgi:integrase
MRDIQTWINEVARTCQCCAQGKDATRVEKKRRCCAVGKCCEDRLPSRTVSNIQACLRAALSRAVTEDLITKNMVTSIKLTSVRKRKGKAWSSDEARHSWSPHVRSTMRSMPVYVLILVLGLRKGEVLGLTWDDVDLDEGELSIGRQLQRVSQQLLHWETKTATSDATLPLPDICGAALRLRKVEEAHARAGRGGVTGWKADLHPQVGHADRTAQLQPLLGCPLCQSWGSEDHSARRASHLRHAAGRSGRSPPRGHADPAPRAD